MSDSNHNITFKPEDTPPAPTSKPPRNDTVSTIADIANEEDKAWGRWHNLD